MWFKKIIFSNQYFFIVVVSRRSVKHYFFLNAGDFILHFLSLCGAELVKNVDDVMPSRLESLLELALRTSTANADPFKDDLGLELLSYDLTTQMVRILSIQTHEERGNHSASLISFCSPIKIDAVFFFLSSGWEPLNGAHTFDRIGSFLLYVPCSMACFSCVYY